MIVVVSGYPRSGTSAMCQALEAGGMTVVKTEASRRWMEGVNDPLYKMVDKDVYETTSKERTQIGWPRMHDGEVIKVVVPWLAALRVHDYRVIFMRRDYEEIRQSCIGAFRRAQTLEVITSQTEEGKLTLLNRRDVRDLTEVWFKDFVARPVEILKSLALPIDVSEAASIVKPEMYRFKRELLAQGV